jgi:hypothetical protein
MPSSTRFRLPAIGFAAWGGVPGPKTPAHRPIIEVWHAGLVQYVVAPPPEAGVSLWRVGARFFVCSGR